MLFNKVWSQKNGPLFIVKSILMYKSQLIQKSLSNQESDKMSVICMGNFFNLTQNSLTLTQIPVRMTGFCQWNFTEQQ